MKATTCSLLAAAVIGLACPAALADEASHRRAVENLLKAMGVEKQLQTSIDQTLDMQVKANPQIAPLRPTLKEFFTKHMSWSSLKGDFIKMYSDAFSEDELNQIRKFYETPAGKKMVE